MHFPSPLPPLSFFASFDFLFCLHATSPLALIVIVVYWPPAMGCSSRHRQPIRALRTGKGRDGAPDDTCEIQVGQSDAGDWSVSPRGFKAPPTAR